MRIRVFIATLLAFTTVGLSAQTPAPWVLVLPAQNETGNAALDPIGSTVADTISLTLRLIGDFEIREIPAEEIPEAVVAGDPAALREYAEEQTMDYIVFGAVRSAGDGFDIDAAVWDRGAGAITVQETGTADSLFSTFEVTDQLAVDFLGAFSGQRIAFGRIQLQRDGWSEGEYRVVIDGAEVARSADVVSNVLVGEREVTVEALSGPQAGEILLDEVVTVAEGGLSTLSFTMLEPEPDPAPEPEPGVAELPQDETIEEEPIEEEPTEAEPGAVADTETEDEPQEDPADEPERNDEGPWTRASRSAPGRRPVYTVGLRYVPTIMRPGSNPGRDRLTAGGTLAAAIEWPRGLHAELALGLAWNRETSDSNEGDAVSSQTEADITSTLQSGAFETIADSRVQGSVTLGWKVWETDLRAVTFDVIPGIVLGAALGNQETYATETSGSVEAGDELNVGVETDDIDNFRVLMVGPRALLRASWRRFSVLLTAQAVYEIMVGGDVDGGELLLSSDPEQPTGVTKQGFENGLTLSGGIGIGYSWGGRPRSR